MLLALAAWEDGRTTSVPRWLPVALTLSSIGFSVEWDRTLAAFTVATVSHLACRRGYGGEADPWLLAAVTLRHGAAALGVLGRSTVAGSIAVALVAPPSHGGPVALPLYPLVLIGELSTLVWGVA
jgi:hypothetical protein